MMLTSMRVLTKLSGYTPTAEYFCARVVLHDHPMYNRPDRGLIVKCTFDRQNKRITFSSARNCSYELLRRKVEQGFSLSHSAYAISYKDDDGEVYEIGTDNDLTEAIQYFQAGTDDPPLSSAASILSGRSFGSKKITLRVHITVEYDGPSLSDTSSLASLEEYKSKNGSEFSFSLGAPSEFEDDAVTVSSRDPDGRRRHLAPPRVPDKGSQLSGESSWASMRSGRSGIGSSQDPTTSDTARVTNPSVDGKKYQDSLPGVFERIKLEEAVQDDSQSVDYDHAINKDWGAAWLRDQNERSLQTMPDVVLNPAESAVEDDGDLALERGPRGKYYYSYTGTGPSSASQSHHEDNVIDEIEPSVDGGAPPTKPRPTSRHLNWLAAQQIATTERSENRSAHSSSYQLTEPSEPSIPEDEILENLEEFPPEFLHYLPVPNVPPEELTDCSECGNLLDAIRYVCSTCGEKPPKSETDNKGKGKDPFDDRFSYPPKSRHMSHATGLQRHLSIASSAPSFSSSSQTYVGTGSVYDGGGPGSPTTPRYKHVSGLQIPGVNDPLGYELCAGCIESAGVTHAIEAGLAPGSSPLAPNTSPSSPEDAQRALQWRRAAPRHKGQLRHAYQEKIWGHAGWEDVVQDEYYSLVCSACDSSASTPRNRLYKCASCVKYYLCRACYSQVHDIHPSHAFLDVPKPEKSSGSSYTESEFLSATVVEPGEEQSLVHVGIKCSHCLLEIVGPRFHCAICESVDICSNCEAAGLPGNLHQAEGGHSTAHIMIKIPYPIERQKVQNASKRAMNLWIGRDASSVLNNVINTKSKATSELSYARTVMGNGHAPLPTIPDYDHHMFCNSCNHPILGTRYQCAHCSSIPTSYSLCASCEERSYLVHDPTHIFFKIPRPVQRQIESRQHLLPHKLYRLPAGPQPGFPAPHNPKDYLVDVVHTAALCDRCMEKIQGCWFRCAYCGIDLCDACEELDTHNDQHIFIVFKSLIDMEILKVFAQLDNPAGSPPVIPYAIYF